MPSCNRNEIYSCCGSCVQRSCINLVQHVYCKQCAEGCFCRPGYIRKVPGGPCVPVSTRSIRFPRCNRNEVYTCCGPCVQDTCKPALVEVNCLLACTEGCVCRPGYVRRVSGGACVRKSKCPKKLVL
uniref:TIL domain-containing protein n=1 Tax=Anopheles minimus TaxID=112268 RepID=A0A182VXC3_9DIPT